MDGVNQQTARERPVRTILFFYVYGGVQENRPLLTLLTFFNTSNLEISALQYELITTH